MKLIKNPVPGGKNALYNSDTGVDIACPVGSKVLLPLDGFLIYAEQGHTKWYPSPSCPNDTPNSILIQLEKPLVVNSERYFYLWFTHLSRLEVSKMDDGTVGHLIKAGSLLGYSGTGNNNDHLHFGLIVNRAQDTEDDWMPPKLLASIIDWENYPVKDETKKDHWAKADFDELKKKGIVSEEKNFSSPVSWGEFCVIINRLIKKMW